MVANDPKQNSRKKKKRRMKEEENLRVILGQKLPRTTVSHHFWSSVRCSDVTAQINVPPPDICLHLVLDCYRYFFSVCRKADLKCWVVVWSKIQVKFFLLQTQCKCFHHIQSPLMEACQRAPPHEMNYSPQAGFYRRLDTELCICNLWRIHSWKAPGCSQNICVSSSP